MKKHVAYTAIACTAIVCFLCGAVVGQIMQARQAALWIEGPALDPNIEMLKLIEENKAMLEKLSEYAEAIEDFLSAQERKACIS